MEIGNVSFWGERKSRLPMLSKPGFEPEPHWWETRQWSTTAPLLLSKEQVACPCNSVCPSFSTLNILLDLTTVLWLTISDFQIMKMTEPAMTVMVNLERSDLCPRISQNVSPANHTKNNLTFFYFECWKIFFSSFQWKSCLEQCQIVRFFTQTPRNKKKVSCVHQ